MHACGARGWREALYYSRCGFKFGARVSRALNHIKMESVRSSKRRRSKAAAAADNSLVADVRHGPFNFVYTGSQYLAKI